MLERLSIHAGLEVCIGEEKGYSPVPGSREDERLCPCQSFGTFLLPLYAYEPIGCLSEKNSGIWICLPTFLFFAVCDFCFEHENCFFWAFQLLEDIGKVQPAPWPEVFHVLRIDELRIHSGKELGVSLLDVFGELRDWNIPYLVCISR